MATKKVQEYKTTGLFGGTQYVVTDGKNRGTGNTSSAANSAYQSASNSNNSRHEE